MQEGRPTKFKKKYIKEVDIYLDECVDEYEQVVKMANEEKGYEAYDNKLKVKLPTIEGFALRLKVSKKSLYNWAEKNERFLHALRKIEKVQKERLINMGLSGEYNSTIAKLILSSNHGMSDKTDITSGGKRLNPTDEIMEKVDKKINEYLDVINGNSKGK